MLATLVMDDNKLSHGSIAQLYLMGPKFRGTPSFRVIVAYSLSRGVDHRNYEVCSLNHGVKDIIQMARHAAFVKCL